jgi:dTDP-4-amino-4,6-dideoxygalactose transaminase
MGSNLRLTEFHAAILLAQLSRLPKQAAKREENAKLLNKWLKKIPGIHPVPDDPRVNPRSGSAISCFWGQRPICAILLKSSAKFRSTQKNADKH